MPWGYSEASRPYESNLCIAVVSEIIRQLHDSKMIFAANNSPILSHAGALADNLTRKQDVIRNSQQSLIIVIGSSDAKAVHQWTITTHKLLVENIPAAMERSKDSRAREASNTVRTILTGISNLVWTSEAQEGLEVVFRSAVEVIQAMHLHPARFEMLLPQALRLHTGNSQPFEGNIMEDTAGFSDDELRFCTITGSLFPAIFKTANERGEPVSYLIISPYRPVVSKDAD